MPIETADLHQKAVLLSASGYDDYGEHKVGTAVEINVRWESGQREALDPSGATIAADALVFVDRAIPIGSILWLGTLAAYKALATKSNLMEVINYREIPDLKARHYRREVTVMRYSDELPAST